MKKKYTMASFFAGVGGIDLGFLKIAKTLYANEINEKSIKTFEINFNIKVDNRDIKDVSHLDIPDVDIFLAGFPCQAFSLAGYRKGFLDDKGRGTLFFEVLRILKEKKPSVVFLENVKNLVSHDNGNTFRTIVDNLKEAGYFVKYQVLNAKDYGNTPQNRERIYIVGFKNKKHCNKFDFPFPIKLTKKISNYISKEKVPNAFYYTKANCKFYEELKQNVTNNKSIYQWRRKYVRENKSNVCPTLTANMGTGGHNVPIVLTEHGIRKLTPNECFLFQGFPIDFKIPEVANSHLYTQSGNSVCVKVIERIATNIKLAIE